MARVSASGLTTAVPTSLRGPQLIGTGTTDLWVREVGVFNSTTTSMTVGLIKISATGTKGAGLTETVEDMANHTVVGDAYTTTTTDATTSGGTLRYAHLGAAIGSGVIWTFPDNGLYVAASTSAGLMIYTPSGTGQQISFYFVWNE